MRLMLPVALLALVFAASGCDVIRERMYADLESPGSILKHLGCPKASDAQSGFGKLGEVIGIAPDCAAERLRTGLPLNPDEKRLGDGISALDDAAQDVFDDVRNSRAAIPSSDDRLDKIALPDDFSDTCTPYSFQELGACLDLGLKGFSNGVGHGLRTGADPSQPLTSDDIRGLCPRGLGTCPWGVQRGYEAVARMPDDVRQELQDHGGVPSALSKWYTEYHSFLEAQRWVR